MNPMQAVAAATERARQSWMRQVQAAKHCVGSEENHRRQLQARARKAEGIVDDLVDAQ